MSVYNVSKIENWYDNFISCKNRFINTYYDDYVSSYIKQSSNDTLYKMVINLNKRYNRIKRIYNSINTYWQDYVKDLKSTENRLAGKSGSISVSEVSAKIATMPHLKEYKADLSIKFANAGAKVGTPTNLQWIEDNVTWETACVIGTSVVSGIIDLAETLVDGLIYCGGFIASGVTWIFDEETSKKIQEATMDITAYDVTRELNKAFYEDTKIGRRINANSAIKHDSEIAQTIQGVSKKVVEFAAATAVTIATGGTATPVVLLTLGFLEGTGEKAEEAFQQEDRDFWGDSLGIAVGGVTGAIEFYSEGMMGSGIVNLGKALVSSGGASSLINTVKSVFTKGGGKLFTKEKLMQGLKMTLKDVDTYVDSVGAAANNITYDKENGLQVDWQGLVKETLCNWVLNFTVGTAGNALSLNYDVINKEYKIQNTDEFKQLNKNARNIYAPSDEFGYMSYELGTELENLFEPDYVVGIHRTGYTLVDGEYLNDVFTKGLINNNGSMQGAMSSKIDLNETVSTYNSFMKMYGNVKDASGYKGSNGVVVVKIPKSYLDDADLNINKIYSFENDTARLRPEFIYGYVPVSESGVCGDIIRNLNYKDTADISYRKLFDFKNRQVSFLESKTISNNIKNAADLDKIDNEVKIDTIKEFLSGEKINVDSGGFDLLRSREIRYNADVYNALLDLKTKGYSNYDLSFLDDINNNLDNYLHDFENRIFTLNDSEMRNCLICTKEEWDQIDFFDDLITKLKKDYGTKFSIKGLTDLLHDYPSGKVDANNLPSYLSSELEKNPFMAFDFDEYESIKKSLGKYHDFIVGGKMIENYSKLTEYVSAEKINETVGVNFLTSDNIFNSLIDAENAVAFNNGENSYMKFTDDFLIPNISHENIHQLSANAGKFGIKVDEAHRGINETFTEYINEIVMDSNYPKDLYCAYQPMVERLKMLTSKGVLTNDEIMKSYFNNDISILRDKINGIADYDCYDKLVKAFSNAHDNKDYFDLDQVCMELIYILENGTSK